MRIDDPMPELPILILLPSLGPPDSAAIERGPDGDPMVLGLSLVQRTVLAARRAGYGQVLLLGDMGAAGAAGMLSSSARR